MLENSTDVASVLGNIKKLVEERERCFMLVSDKTRVKITSSAAARPQACAAPHWLPTSNYYGVRTA